MKTNTRIDALLAMIERLQPEEFIERRMGEIQDIYSRLVWNGSSYELAEAVCAGVHTGEMLVTVELMTIAGKLRQVHADVLWIAEARQ